MKKETESTITKIDGMEIPDWIVESEEKESSERMVAKTVEHYRDEATSYEKAYENASTKLKEKNKAYKELNNATTFIFLTGLVVGAFAAGILTFIITTAGG